MAIFARAEFLRRKILEKLQFFNILSYAEFHAESDKTTPEIFGIAEHLQKLKTAENWPFLAYFGAQAHQISL